MEKLQTLFRNASIVAVGSAVASSPVFAESLIDTATTAALDQASGDGTSVGKLVIAAVAIIVGVSLVISMMRKA